MNDCSQQQPSERTISHMAQTSSFPAERLLCCARRSRNGQCNRQAKPQTHRARIALFSLKTSLYKPLRIVNENENVASRPVLTAKNGFLLRNPRWMRSPVHSTRGWLRPLNVSSVVSQSSALRHTRKIHSNRSIKKQFFLYFTSRPMRAFIKISAGGLGQGWVIGGGWKWWLINWFRRLWHDWLFVIIDKKSPMIR